MEILFLIIFIMFVFIFLTYAPSERIRKVDWLAGHYAHRGLYRFDQTIPENSFTAFQNAIDHHYGIELDLQSTKDGVVMVFHDDSLKRLCGIDRNLEEMNYDEVKSLRLSETDQLIPRFIDVLTQVNGQAVLIIEIKTTQRRTETVKQVMKLTEEYNGKFVLCSFDPLILYELKSHYPKVLRGQLTYSYKDETNKPFWLRFMLRNCMFNFLNRPDYISIRYDQLNLSYRLNRILKAFGFGWPLASQAEEDLVKNQFEVIIFEHYLPN